MNPLLEQMVGRTPGKGRRVVAIACQNNQITIIQALHREKRVTLEKQKVLHVPMGNDAEQALALKAFWQQEAFGGDEVILLYPLREAIVKTLSLPSTRPEEIRDMVRLQAARQSPLGLDEITTAYRILDKTAEGYSRVMLVLVRKEDLARHLHIFSAADIALTQVALDTWTVLPWLHGTDSATGVSMALCVNEKDLWVGLFNGSKLELSRSLVLRSLDRHDLELELERTLQGLPGTHGSPGLRVDVCGDDASMLRVNAIFHDKGVEVRRISTPMNATLPVSWPVLAAALSDPACSVSPNLLSEEDQSRLSQSRRRQQAAAFAVVASLFVAVLAGLGAQRYHAQSRELQALEASQATLADSVKDLRRMERKVSAVRNQMSQEGSFLKVVSDLRRRVPEGISFRAVEFERHQSLLLQGHGRSLAGVVHLVELLQKSPLFASVELRSSDSQRIQDHDQIEFSIECRFAKSKRPGGGPHA